ncbi:MAG: XrtA system polysaccharide chain length determinant [Pseudomonadota bacterium]
MNAYIEQLTTVLYGVWRKRWYGLVAMWLICVLGWIVVALIPDKYESSARIYVDTNSVLGQVMGDRGMSSTALRQVFAMRRTLVSRPNLEKVVRRVDLDLTTETDAEMEKLITELSKNIRIRSEGDDLFWISYVSGSTDFSDRENAELAKRIVQNLIAIFFDSDVMEGRDDIANVQRFLEDQIKDYERQLAQAERRRAEFKRENLGLLPGDRNFLSRIERNQQELSKTEDQLNELSLKVQELERQKQTVSPVMTSTGLVGGSPIGSVQAQQLQALQAQVEDLLARGYTDKYPDVVTLNRRIEDLKERLKSTPADDPDANIGQGQANPVFTDIQLQLVRTRTQIASLNGRREKLLAEISDLKDAAKDAPLVEAEMANLDRDYNILQSKYNELIVNREEAKQYREINSKADKVKFRIIDPPEVPLTPVAPDRQLLLTMVLGAGLAAGLGISFIFSQLQSSFATMEQLRQTFAMPVLGSVTSVLSDQQRSQRKLEVWAFGVLFFAVFLTYGAVMLWELTQQLGSNIA